MRCSGLTNETRSRRQVAGLTLIELMVAMVIGLLVVLVAARLYLGGSSAQREVDDRGALMETGQMALELLSREVANAAFYPAVSSEATLSSGASGSNVLVSFDAAIQSLNNGQVPAALKTGVFGCSNGVLNANQSECTAHAGGGAGDTLVVSYFTNDAFSLDVGQRADCTRADVGNAAVNATRVGTVVVPGEEDGEEVEQARGSLGLPPVAPLLVANSYFLQPVQYVDASGNQVNTRALSCRGIGNPAAAVQLVPGVEQMVVRFGVMSDDTLTPKQFLSATDVDDLAPLTLANGGVYQPWQRVVAVRLCIMVRSISASRFNDGGGARQILDCNGDALNLPAGVAMERFTQVIGVKNRQLNTVGL